MGPEPEKGEVGGSWVFEQSRVLEGEDAERFLEKVANQERTGPVPTPRLGETLRRIREDAIKKGMRLLSEDEVLSYTGD